MQNEGETDNKKAMIIVSFNYFSTPRKSRMFIYYTTLYSHYTHPSNHGLI